MRKLMPRITLISLLLLLAGCSTLSSMNPFSSNNGAKIAELQPIKAALEARIVWRESAGKSDVYAFSPAIVGSTVYAASHDGRLTRFDEGKPIWKINAGQLLSGGVGADLSRVIVGSVKGEVLAFASADGKLLWQAKANGEILSPPVVGGGLVVIRTSDNRLAAYDVLNGKRKWVFQRPTPALSVRMTASPVIDGQYVFAGFPSGKLIAVSLSNGVAVWDGTVALPKGATELDRAADIASAPDISGRSICAVAFQGRIACFDLVNGNLIWARDMSSTAGLSINNRYVYVTDEKGSVHALDLAGGGSLWKQDKLLNRRVTAPLAHRHFVAVADAQGLVHFLNREDGSFIARVPTDGSPIVAPLQLLGSRVLVQTSNGGIYAIEVE